jgi:hypothetical protein
MRKPDSQLDAPKPLVTEAQLCTWLGAAPPCDVVEYHRGVLALDISPYARRLSERDREELKRVARRAVWAWERGRVHLVQKRHGPDDYSYLMVARQWAEPATDTKNVTIPSLEIDS